jgi:hypothetical protein
VVDGKYPSTLLPGIDFRRYSSQAHPYQIKVYQEKVGLLLYTAIIIRPDIAFAALVLFQFLTNPAPEHFIAIDWALRYLFGIRFLAIQYNREYREVQLQIASDALYIDDLDI